MDVEGTVTVEVNAVEDEELTVNVLLEEKVRPLAMGFWILYSCQTLPSWRALFLNKYKCGAGLE